MEIYKKIGIITILNVNNYGAELQAFALQHKLNKLGYNAEIINYLFYKNPSYRHVAKATSLFPLSLKTKLKERALSTLDLVSKTMNWKISKTRSSRFDEFHRKHSKLTRKYESYDSLYGASHDHDVFVVGSDQVWNPNNPINLSPYFLTFAPKEALKMSYASSFGVDDISVQFHDQYKSLLNNLNILSCREQSGVSLIKKITGREATHVLDPTLLLTKEEWNEFVTPFDIKEKYIVLFIFKESSYIKELADKIKAATGYRVIRICKNEMRVENDSEILNLRDLGPKEFLGVFQKASFVITTSFHGTAFSLIFEKPFYTITPSSKNNNARQESLLRKVGLEARLLKEDSLLPSLDSLDIDFGNVRNILHNERQKSVKYLTESINVSKK